MSLSEYTLRSLALRAEFRASNRALAFLFEIGRGAATMALVLTVADLAGLVTFAPTPGKRLAFVFLWALLMAGVDAVRQRATAPLPSH